MAKTHEVWLDFGPATRPEAEAQEQARRFASPPAARADAAWIAATRVFRPFLPRDEKSFPTIEEQFRARWEGETYLQDRCHDYGLLHYGDRHSQDYPIGPNAKFQSVHRYWLVTDYRCGMEPWLLWARSGDRLYFRWAEVISRHLMDVDVVHWTLEDVTPPRRAGQFYPMSFAHYCSGVGSMSLHNDPIGFNQMAWFLTGYRRSLDVLLAAGRRELECDLTAGEMHRGHAVTGHNQLDVYRLTWDDRHWSSAFNAINKGLDAMTARTYLDPVYVWEWLHDIQDFTGDSRLKHAVLNIADRIIGQPRGTTNSYPAVYVFGHAYELTGDPRYIAWGKGKLEMDMSNIALSQDPERRGRVTAADNIHFTRLFRQAPGFLHYLKEAEAKHGPIARRTQPIKFIYERGPVYLREDTDRPFRVTLHLSFAAGANVRGEARLLSPDGKLAVRKAVDSEKMADLKNRLVFEVPADGQVGTYRLDLDVPTDGGKVQGTWGVECPDLAKIAHELTRFTFYGGHVFFHVPKGTKAFRLYVEPRRFAAAYGQPVVLGPDGRERLRLDGLKPEWVTIQPKPEDTDGVWGVVLFYIGVFQMDGLPPFVFSDPSEWFLPEAGARRPPDTKPAGAAAPR
jgi:hypothetical protein